MSDTTPEADRTVTVTARRSGKPWFTRKQITIMIGLGLIVVVGFTAFNGGKKQTKDPEDNLDVVSDIGRVAPYTPPIVKPEERPAPVQQVVAPIPQRQVEQPPLIRQVTQSHKPSFDTYSVASLPDSWKPKQANAAGGSSGSGTGKVPSRTHIAYKASSIPGAKASPMGDTSMVLMPGLLRCTMLTDIDSTLQGPFQCQVRGDVYSEDNVLLISSGLIINGTYDNRVQQGQRRLSLTGGYAIQNKCIIPFGGPMADSLGKAGADGEYDPHTWEKLGGAITLMLAQNAFQIAQAALQNSSNNGSNSGNTYLNFQTGGVSNLASQLLQSTINIPATITIHHGQDLALWLPGPTDFSDCYHLEAAND